MQKMILFSLYFLILAGNISAQDKISRIAKAVSSLQNEPEMKHGQLALVIVDNKTGKQVYASNGEIGLVPASCQKVIVALAAMDILGADYQFKTGLYHDGKISDGVLKGNLYVTGSGDPTLGTNRWPSTTPNAIASNLKSMLKNSGINSIVGNLIIDNNARGNQPVPDGWIWQDVGNYYGSGSCGINWLENQYRLSLRSGDTVGSPVSIIRSEPKLGMQIINQLTSAATGSGDNAYLYPTIFENKIFASGTIPQKEKSFTIRGALPNPEKYFANWIKDSVLGERLSGAVLYITSPLQKNKLNKIGEVSSPALAQIIQPYLTESINLYGEAIAKEIAFSQNPNSRNFTLDGVKAIKDFWLKNGIEKSSLKIVDGSGLSPLNRLTAASLAYALYFAKNKNAAWWKDFYEGLPTINGLKMKSGYIEGARSYAGYVQSGNNNYSFAIIANNYDFSPTVMRQKMFKVLDELK